MRYFSELKNMACVKAMEANGFVLDDFTGGKEFDNDISVRQFTLWIARQFDYQTGENLSEYLEHRPRLEEKADAVAAKKIETYYRTRV